MALVAFYLVTCVVRLTMPGIEARDRNIIGLTRVAIALLGVGVALGFMFIVFKTQGRLVKDPENAQTIALLIFGVFVAIAEYVARRRLRKLGVFPVNKHIPWTY